MNTENKAKCKKHEWEPMFREPGKEASQDLYIDWFGLCLKQYDRYHVCKHCGGLGSIRRGYSKGGHNALKACSPDPDHDRELREKARQWNAKQVG